MPPTWRNAKCWRVREQLTQEVCNRNSRTSWIVWTSFNNGISCFLAFSLFFFLSLLSLLFFFLSFFVTLDGSGRPHLRRVWWRVQLEEARLRVGAAARPWSQPHQLKTKPQNPIKPDQARGRTSQKCKWKSSGCLNDIDCILDKIPKNQS